MEGNPEFSTRKILNKISSVKFSCKMRLKEMRERFCKSKYVKLRDKNTFNPYYEYEIVEDYLSITINERVYSATAVRCYSTDHDWYLIVKDINEPRNTQCIDIKHLTIEKTVALIVLIENALSGYTDAILKRKQEITNRMNEVFKEKAL